MSERDWHLPDIAEILRPPRVAARNESMLRRHLSIIEQTLDSLGLSVSVIEVNSGPRATEFVLQPRQYGRRRHRTKSFSLKRVESHIQDLALALRVPSVSVGYARRGQETVAVWVPNKEPEVIVLREVLESNPFVSLSGYLRLGLGSDARGTPLVADLCDMPHLLIGGTTGSGKSVCIHTIVASLLLLNTPNSMHMLMVDTKGIELSCYNSIPHLTMPVVVEPDDAIAAFRLLRKEAADRFQSFQEARVRDIASFNSQSVLTDASPIPYVVVIVDEIADVANAHPRAVRNELGALARAGRQAGIHLVVATIRPSLPVIAPTIKASFPARIAFKMTTKADSRTILDSGKPEDLAGCGDMLFQHAGFSEPIRAQGAYISYAEVDQLAAFWADEAPTKFATAKDSEP